MSSSHLKPLTEDHKRYQDTFNTAFNKIAERDVVFEKVTQFFDKKVMKTLTDVFDRDDEFSILGIGVGEGSYECRYLKSIETFFSSVCISAVDPNEFMLTRFEERIGALKSNGKSAASCHLVNGPISQFFAEDGLSKNKYNLVSSVHSIYYLGDFETTFTKMASMVKDNGFIIIFCSKDDLILKSFSKFSWVEEISQANHSISSTVIREFAEILGYDVTSSEIVTQWDITEVFDDQSDLGNKLLDFFTHFAFFRQTAPSELVDELMNFWRSVSTEDEDGRIFTPSYEEILVISK
ncbi:histamine N-methyltransferase B-like [Lytechinus variegatus]|uniref:histamine N-methyltransferase B-like n=1 Tax=Lytechinus variegatus TaxID=7654 RepID=UPI001BB2AF8F|nr:histamine N-methyltransferase B-like [Lytechinus variegatus]